MAPPTRRSLSRRIPWTTAVPLLALVVLAGTWGRYPPTVVAVLIGVVLHAARCSRRCTTPRWSPHRVGEPFGSLVLAVAVTVIEVGADRHADGLRRRRTPPRWPGTPSSPR